MNIADADLVFESLAVRDIETVLGRVRVRSGGEGPAILFWSSLLMSGRMWSRQAAFFRARHRVLLVDPPGHGDSAPLTRHFSFEECAQVVVQILDALGLAHAHYVGNSWGGMIGATFAARHPQRVGLAVLMNCTASPAGLRQTLEYSLLAQLARRVGRLHGPLTGTALRAFAGPTTERERPQVVDEIRAALARVDLKSASWAVASVVPRRPDQLALCATIRTPVLVIAVREDRTFPVAETQAMAQAIPGAEFIVLDRSAHLSGLETPDEVNALIAARLAL